MEHMPYATPAPCKHTVHIYLYEPKPFSTFTLQSCWRCWMPRLHDVADRRLTSLLSSYWWWEFNHENGPRGKFSFLGDCPGSLPNGEKAPIAFFAYCLHYHWLNLGQWTFSSAVLLMKYSIFNLYFICDCLKKCLWINLDIFISLSTGHDGWAFPRLKLPGKGDYIICYFSFGFKPTLNCIWVFCGRKKQSLPALYRLGWCVSFWVRIHCELMNVYAGWVCMYQGEIKRAVDLQH